jgi:NADH:ubiquinone oxidoreductase subunit 4 (subunit M)
MEMAETNCQNTECVILYPVVLYYICVGLYPAQLLKLKPKFVNFLETVHLTISE